MRGISTHRGERANSRSASGWATLTSLLALAFLVLVRAELLGQTCVTYGPGNGCEPPLHPTQCYPVASGPALWQDVGGEHTWQYRRAVQSPNKPACEPVLGESIINCCGGLPPGGVVPTAVPRIVGTRILIDYDAPGLYCNGNLGDWPPTYSCTNDPEVSTDRLTLLDGNNNVIRRAYIYFEHGTWDTGVDIPCGQTQNHQAAIKYLTTGGLVQSLSVVTSLPSTCPDRKECGDQSGTSVGLPINVGSGDVMVRQPLFAIAQEPMSLPFTLTYHSSVAMFPSLISEPVGKGWTHEYNQILKAEPGTNGDRLYRVTPEGYEEEYLRIAPLTTWIAINPGEARGTVTTSGSEYLLTDLNGAVTRFDTTSGRWNSTTDRWGNAITGTYNGSGQLITITDSMGRQITISYTASLVTITLPNTKTWKLTLAGGLMTAIKDPLHSATNWRTYTYANDHAGVQRLLTSIKDDATPTPQELEGHTYDNVAGTGTDRGLTSYQAGGTKSNVSVAYDSNTQRTVTHTIDTGVTQTSVFTLEYRVGRWLPTQISGNCATCGGADADLSIFTYDYSNHVISRKQGDPGQSQQVETQYTYNGDGMMLSKTEAVGTGQERLTTYAYAAGTPANFLSPWPAFMTSTIEESAAKLGSDKTTTYTWSNSGSCASASAERCLQTTVSGYLLSTDSSPTTYTTTTKFDDDHRVTDVLGPATNQRVTYAYNANAATNNGGRRNLTQVYTSSTAHLDTSFASYDLYGTAWTVTDPNGAQTLTTTDDRGRVLTVQSKAPTADTNEPGPYTTTYAYDTRDRLSSVTLPLGNKTHYCYENGTNRLTDTIRADSSNLKERIHLTLNTIGSKKQEDFQLWTSGSTPCTATWGSSQRTDTYTYDARNRLQKITHSDPGATHIDYTYDTRGNLRTVQDENHSSANTTYTYDALNRLTGVSQVLGTGSVTTSYGYDDGDNLTSVTDPNGNITTYNFDDFRRMQKQVSPVSGTATYGYDPAGNLLTSTDANSATTTRTYDAANRILTSTSTRSGRATETTSWTYDNATLGGYGGGRVGRVTEPTGTTQYSYDRRGLVKAERKAAWDNTFSTLYGYDANGNRTTITYPSKRVVTYTYDFADRPLTAAGQLPGGPIVNYISSGGTTYKPFGPPTQLKFGNGTTRTMQYDQRYRMTLNKLVKDAGSVTLANYSTITYDGVGNVTAIPDAVDSTYSRTSMVYDDLNRLTSASTGSSLWQTGTYSYDSMGNVSSLSLSSGGTVRSASFSYSGTTPKITSVTEQSPIGTRAVTYDSAGNEIQVGASSNSFQYSARNFLSVAAGDGAFAYDYDGRGVRTVSRANVLAITGLLPASRPAGQGQFTLTVYGTKFTGSSVVKWNGANRTTTFVSANQLSATINAGDVSVAGTLAPVTVFDVVTSNATNFVVDFADEPSNDPFYPFVTIVAARGITAGCGGGNFCPTTSIRRDQMSVFLLKAKEGSAYVPPNCVGLFTDVTCPGTFTNWVEDAYNRGIMDKCGSNPNIFCPTTAVTRETMADFLLKGLEGSTYVPPPAVGIFSDVPISNPHAAFIEELARRGITGGCGAGIYCPTNPVTRAQMATFLSKTWGFTSNVTPAGNKRFFIYSPELSLIAESEYTSSYHPQVFYEHMWLGGTPVAEVDTGSSTTHWTLTDHLGTPIMQTDSAAASYWRIEQEPYGRIWTKRPSGQADQHQVLRLPGQEAEQLTSNAKNGNSERFYNIFRWYRPNWGRYSQADPLYLSAEHSLYGYVDGNPLAWHDRLGLHAGGGPFHPGIPVACTSADDCPTLQTKISLISRTLSSHRRYDKTNPEANHSQEVQDWIRAIEKCKEFYERKCRFKEDCPSCETAKTLTPVLLGAYFTYKVVEAIFCPVLVPITP